MEKANHVWTKKLRMRPERKSMPNRGLCKHCGGTGLEPTNDQVYTRDSCEQAYADYAAGETYYRIARKMGIKTQSAKNMVIKYKTFLRMKGDGE